MIKYTIREYGVMPDNERYVVGFGLINTENDREAYVQCYVPVEGNDSKSQSEICSLAFSGSFDKVAGVSGALESVPTVIGAEFVPPGM
tara:strand:- start:138 stop:401 length:264 start_codon:yes stop_codon:yes gene_type:complete